jgi:branched-chain amino acid transport system permease protein
MSGLDTLREADEKRLKVRRGIRDRWGRLPKWQRMLGLVALVVFLYYLPYLGIPGLVILRTDYSANGSDWASTLFTCSIYVLIALGLNVVVGLAGLLDLGYVGFFAVGSYSVGLFTSPDSPVLKWMRQEFNLGPHWAMAWGLTIPVAIAITMISGVILGGPTLRLRGDYLAIVTLGFGEIVRLIALNATGLTNGPQGLSSIPGPPGKNADGTKLFGVVDVAPWYWLALTVLIIFAIGVRRLENSRVGRAWLAVREDEDAAAVMGVNGFKFKLWAFAIGAALGGVSGVLFASRQAYIDPTSYSLNLSVIFVAMVVVGGSGNIAGVALGAILVTYLQERFRGFADYRPLSVGVALIVVMILRPQGLIPSRRRARELHDRAEEVPENVVA